MRAAEHDVRPQLNTLREDLNQSLATLHELTLSRVIFGPTYAQLEFTGEWNVYVQIDKDFVVSTGLDTSFTVDVFARSQREGIASLVALIGAKTDSFRYEPTALQVKLQGAHVTVPLCDADFDPVQISCTHHMSPSQLAWRYVVLAGM